MGDEELEVAIESENICLVITEPTGCSEPLLLSRVLGFRGECHGSGFVGDFSELSDAD